MANVKMCFGTAVFDSHKNKTSLYKWLFLAWLVGCSENINTGILSVTQCYQISVFQFQTLCDDKLHSV